MRRLVNGAGPRSGTCCVAAWPRRRAATSAPSPPSGGGGGSSAGYGKDGRLGELPDEATLAAADAAFARKHRVEPANEGALPKDTAHLGSYDAAMRRAYDASKEWRGAIGRADLDADFDELQRRGASAAPPTPTAPSPAAAKAATATSPGPAAHAAPTAAMAAHPFSGSNVVGGGDGKAGGGADLKKKTPMAATTVGPGGAHPMDKDAATAGQPSGASKPVPTELRAVVDFACKFSQMAAQWGREIGRAHV